MTESKALRTLHSDRGPLLPRSRRSTGLVHSPHSQPTPPLHHGQKRAYTPQALGDQTHPCVSQTSSSPEEMGVPLKSGGHWASPRSHSTVPTELIPFGPWKSLKCKCKTNLSYAGITRIRLKGSAACAALSAIAPPVRILLLFNNKNVSCGCQAAVISASLPRPCRK